MSSSRLRSSISPFRSRKSSSSSSSSSKRPTTPSSTTSAKAPTLPPAKSSFSPSTPSSDCPPGSSGKTKENVTVTVRFRPLNAREIGKGDELAWYADGDYTVRNENNPKIAYSFDKVFGPATTTRHVYDVAAQHVVGGAMEGINGTVFAYGVTSSGKTHTMHGEQKSPGIIPLAVKDVFGIIQETPGREFLLRVSYLEIYNEVINDLLDPTGQNLRVREDGQGTYVEGIKEEVVLSPAHALSLIASGEEHRHVGSNNFNLLSSRSHTIFTLTIESSSRGGNQGEEVALSQLHLIDLAGSESSKTETTGLRRKEGSFINKSLLTLGTVSYFFRVHQFIAVQGDNRSVIITPEIAVNAGWGDIAQKILRLINVPEKEKKVQIVTSPVWSYLLKKQSEPTDGHQKGQNPLLSKSVGPKSQYLEVQR
ncbi:PREDICTED: kinesin-like protein KIN-7E, chloroplastic [Nicotiana attenuata]|uniref:kinesin-like protein KIN-7E, chloroplastic n=1 Tax=Nicotiana attenuata TaxID=49451 RepID=UPI0009056517|nr:PREDICTED: kinesin-like protein KIN-7E, chloroplastic [Nicotiana attenuata]